MKRLGVILAVAGCLSACETPYQEMGYLGGVSATRITADTAQVTARGNAYTDVDTVQRYALRRAAEETVADGFDLFVIDSGSDRTRVGVATSGGVFANGRGAFGYGFSAPIIKPGQTIMIKMLHGPRPDPMPDGEYDAREVLQYLGQASAAADDHKDCATSDGKVVCR
jgi:hypothetical protein